ncbi:TolB-like translocation protein, partial [Halocola ammonii]
MKFNLATCEKNVLVNNTLLLTQPEWSRTGLIAFDKESDYQIQLINSDGTQQDMVSGDVHNLNPVWNNSGTKLYWQHTPTLGVPYYFFEYDIGSTVTDTLKTVDGDFVGSTLSSDISFDDKLIAETAIDGEIQIGFSSLENFELTPLVSLVENDLASITGLCWSNTNDKAYFTELRRGLYQLEVPSGEYTQLIDFCDNYHYRNICCSQDGSQLIAERVDRELITLENGNYSGEIRQTSSIVL